jgi:DNA gyrase subunit B
LWRFAGILRALFILVYPRIQKLFDCREHAPASASELFIVEGDSAAEAVCAVRDTRFQAVLALQGKPVNALKSSSRRVMTSPTLSALTEVLGSAPGTALPLGTLRFEKILILMDPDADGIHAGALLQIFLLRYMPSLLDERRVFIVHAPWGEIRRPGELPLVSFQPEEFHQQSQAQRGALGVERIRSRGLGTITPELLRHHCVDPISRRARELTRLDAQMAAAILGGSPP